jgi:hypothetical protein
MPPARPARLALALLLTLALPAGALAQQPHREAPSLPPALEVWRGWATHGLRDLGCASLGEGRACAWPGALSVQVEEAGARFRLQVLLERPGRVALPGDARHFPQGVTLGDGPALLLRDAEGRPQALLQAGLHVLQGRFDWRRAPETLNVPAEVGVVSLRQGDRALARPRREGEPPRQVPDTSPGQRWTWPPATAWPAPPPRRPGSAWSPRSDSATCLAPSPAAVAAPH